MAVINGLNRDFDVKLSRDVGIHFEPGIQVIPVGFQLTWKRVPASRTELIMILRFNICAASSLDDGLLITARN